MVLPATSYRGEAFAEAAQRVGVELVIGSDLPAAFARLGCRSIRLDLGDPEGAARRALQAEPNGWHGVLGTDESSALVAAHVARLAGLPASDPDGALAARDKWLMRTKLGAAGVPQPLARVLEPELDPSAALAFTTFPCVVKAPMLSGSQGVIRADDADALVAAILRVRRILDRHPSPFRDRRAFHRLVIEQYVDGPEIAVEALMSDGLIEPLAIFDKPDELVGPFFEETLYVTPSRLPAAELATALEVTGAAARALGLRHGPIHAELRLGKIGPMMIELAARSIGGLCSRTFELAAASLEELLVAHAVGLAAPRRALEGAAGVMMIPIPRSGVLRTVHGVERAEAVTGVAGVTISARVGEAVHALPEGGSYLGFVFACAETPEAVERALRAAHVELEFELAPLLTLV